MGDLLRWHLLAKRYSGTVFEESVRGRSRDLGNAGFYGINARMKVHLLKKKSFPFILHFYLSIRLGDFLLLPYDIRWLPIGLIIL